MGLLSVQRAVDAPRPVTKTLVETRPYWAAAPVALPEADKSR